MVRLCLLLLCCGLSLALNTPKNTPNALNQLRRLQRAAPVNPASLPMFNRNLRSVPKDDFDPNLQGLSTEELYRMLEVLDMLEKKKLDKVSQKELQALEMLMAAYN